MTASFAITVQRDIPYVGGGDAYRVRRCRLDLHVPAGAEAPPVLVWFHGGGMTEGDKAAEETRAVATALAARGIAVAAANYRLSPAAPYPHYLRDAATAVAWVGRHAGQYDVGGGGCFLGGHSAGGYLAWMLGLDGRWLAEAGAAPGDLAGLIPISGQAITHAAVRAERGIPIDRIIVDDAAPLNHTSAAAPPTLAICAASDIAKRREENALLCAALVAAGSPDVTLLTIDGRDHMSVILNMPAPGDPVTAAIVAFIARRRLPSAPPQATA
ncbi:MAG: alpha/beta hydrolase [Planctomycetes bacterium]|nr:alpha/beta hydrolase [Planctomycetota bacterium]